MKSFVCLMVLFVAMANCQYIVPGYCPDVPPLTNMKPEKIVGKWHTVKNFPNDFEKEVKCADTNMKSFDDDKMEGLSESVSLKTGKAISLPFVSHYKVNNTVGYFSTEMQLDEKLVKMDSKIIETDYETYMITYACIEKDSKAHHFVWIPSKEKTLTDAATQKVKEFCEKYNLDYGKLQDIAHDC